jgi:hypothetical protein
MNDNLGIFNIDIYQEIIKNANILTIANISSVCKNFNILCSDKQIWEYIFRSKNLKIIDNNIITAGQFINEYRKVSNAKFITNHLLKAISLFSHCDSEKQIYINTKTINSEILIKILSQEFTKIIRMYKNRSFIDEECIIINLHSKYKIEYILTERCGYGSTGRCTSVFADNIDVMRDILYYYPNIKICDSKGNDLRCLEHPNTNIVKYWVDCNEDYKRLYLY